VGGGRECRAEKALFVKVFRRGKALKPSREEVKQ